MDRELVETRKLLAIGAPGKLDSGVGDGSAEGGAEERDENALGDELLEETTEAGAKGGTDVHLGHAAGGAADLEVGGVGAGDEEGGRLLRRAGLREAFGGLLRLGRGSCES